MCAAAITWTRRERCRRCGRLRMRVVVDTSAMTESEVIAHLLQLVKQRSEAVR